MAHGRLIYPPSGGGGGAADGVNIIAAGSQTANSTGTVVFSNSNGVSFGMSNNSVVTASVAGAAAGSISAGTTRATLGELAFSNSNGLSFGISGQTITGSYTVPSTAGLISAVNISAGTTSNNLSALRFQDSNGVSFGLNAGTVTATVRTDYLTSQSNQAFSASGGSSTFQTLNFANSNGVTFSNSAGSVVASHNGLTSQSNQAFSASGGSSTFQTLNFANSNGFTFSNSNGSVIGSYTVPTVPAQTNQTLGLYAVSNTTGASSSSTVDARSLSFQGAGIASVGYSGGSVVISVPSGGGAGDGGNVLAAGTQTANTTGTVVFSNANGVTFGMSNNSVITASVAASGGGGEARNFFNPQDGYIQAGSQQGQATMHLQPAYFPNVTFDRLMMPFVFSNATNSTGSATLSAGFGIYTRNDSTFSLASSTSASWAVTFSGTVGNSTFSGMRLHTIPWSSSVSEGQYYVGIWTRTTTGGANGSWSQFVCSQIGSNLAGHFGETGNASVQYTRGLGQFGTTFSTALPSSINVTAIQGTAFLHMRKPVFAFFNGTF